MSYSMNKSCVFSFNNCVSGTSYVKLIKHRNIQLINSWTFKQWALNYLYASVPKMNVQILNI